MLEIDIRTKALRCAQSLVDHLNAGEQKILQRSLVRPVFQADVAQLIRLQSEAVLCTLTQEQQDKYVALVIRHMQMQVAMIDTGCTRRYG